MGLFSGGSFGSGSSLFRSGVFTLTALDNGVCHGSSDQTDGADGVIVAGDHVVDLIGIAVGVHDGDDGDVQLAGLSNGIALLAGVDDEQSSGQLCSFP